MTMAAAVRTSLICVSSVVVTWVRPVLSCRRVFQRGDEHGRATAKVRLTAGVHALGPGLRPPRLGARGLRAGAAGAREDAVKSSVVHSPDLPATQVRALVTRN